jgi:hypothetical protein
MPDEPEPQVFSADRGASRDSDELLEVGRAAPDWVARLRRPWRRLRYGAPLLICAALAVLGLVTWRTLVHHASPAAAPARPAPIARPAFNSGPLLAVRGLAYHRGPLLGYVRQSTPAGVCALVAPGHSPVRLMSRAIRRVAPGYRITDSAMVLDQFTGLCSVQLRAINRIHDIMVVSVAAPPAHTPRSAFDRVETGIRSGPRATTKYALDVSRTGFRILVGATGPERGLPRAEDLVRLASQPALIW